MTILRSFSAHLIALFLGATIVLCATPLFASDEATNVENKTSKTIVAGVTNDSNQYSTFLRVDPSTKILLTTLTGAIGLPTGASTAALQTTGNAILTTMNAFLSTLATASASQATAAKQDLLSAKFGAIGQGVMAGSAPVVIASDQSALPVTGTFYQATQPVSGTFWQATQPISAASLPLPTGASLDATIVTGNAILTTINGFVSTIATNSATQATAAKQDTGNTSLSSIDGKITAVNTGAVVVSSSALPTGASTEATLSTLAGYMAPWTPYVSNVDAVDATIKGTPGAVGFVTVVAAAGAGSTIVLKNGGAGGTALATIDATVVTTTEYNVSYGTDIYVDNTAAGGGGGSYVVGYH